MKKGIDRNSSPESTSPEFISWAKNSINSELLDAFINERGTKIEVDLTPLNINFINGVWAIGNIIVFTYKNNSAQDCIATIDEKTNVLTVKLTRTDLGFNVLYPVEIRGKFNALGQLKVVLTDKFNSVKYINLDTATSLDPITIYSLFPISKNPNIALNVLDGAGNITTGRYFVAISYLTADRAQSTFSPLSSPISVTNFPTFASFTGVSADLTGKGTNKGLQITLTDVDTAYKKVRIAIVSQISGTIAAQVVKEVDITSSVVNTIYNGIEFIELINIEEIITKNPLYTTAGTMTDINDELLLADLTVDQSTNYQTIANSFTIKWDSNRSISDPFFSSQYKAKYTTFMHEEVYAFYVQFELTKRRFTNWFHIPGPPLNAGDRANSATAVANSGGLKFGGVDPKVFQVEDTSGTPVYDGSVNSYYGDMGKWENANEFYPADFPNYPGQNVRHHKFPSIKKIKDTYGPGSAGYGFTYLDYLGIRIDNTIINAGSNPEIVGYRIGFAKRNLAEQSVLGQTIIQYGANHSSDPNTIINAGGNWNIEINSALYTYNPNKNYVRLNALDTLLDKPSIGDAYLSNLLKFRADNLNTAGFAGIFYGRYANTTGLNAATVYCFATNLHEWAFGVDSVVPTSELIRKLENPKYIPANVLYSVGGVTVDNRLGEDTIFAKVLGPNFSLVTTSTHRAHDSNDSPGLFEEVYLANIKAPKTDFFVNYRSQTIVPIAKIERKNSSNQWINSFYLANFFAGDAYIGSHSYTSLAGERNNPVTAFNPAKGSRMFKFFLCETWNNSNLRTQIDGDYSSYFFPAFGIPIANNSPALWTSLWNLDQPYNVIKYAKDYSTINGFENSDIFNPDIPDVASFPYRIVKSLGTNKNTSLSDGWNIFLANNYFETVRNKGRIIKLENWGNQKVLIHHERALFATRDTTSLLTTTIPITLGSAQLFDIAPIESNPTSYGICGTQHKYSCLLCDIGYVFVDAARGQVFLYNGEQAIDLTKGLRTFFRDRLQADFDNPFYEGVGGISTAYDKDNDRIIVSTPSFTVSFDVTKEKLEWASSHDFLPNHIFNTSKKVYSFKTNKLHRHNIGPRGTYYGVTYPFYVDFIVNDKAQLQKVLSSVSWLTKYRPTIPNSTIPATNQRKTITHITIWNDQHCTGKIPIVTNETKSLFLQNVNAKVKDETWSFDKIYNLVLDSSVPFIGDIFGDFRPLPLNLETNPIWWKQEPLRGKYFIIRLEYDNAVDNQIEIRDMEPQLRLSKN